MGLEINRMCGSNRKQQQPLGALESKQERSSDRTKRLDEMGPNKCRNEWNDFLQCPPLSLYLSIHPSLPLSQIDRHTCYWKKKGSAFIALLFFFHLTSNKRSTCIK